MLKQGIAEYFLAAQVPDQHSRITTATVSRASNGLLFARAENGQEFLLNPDVQKRLGFDADLCSEGAMLLPERQHEPKIGDQLLLMVLVDENGTVVMDVLKYIILWISLEEAERSLREFARSDLMRVFASDRVVWIGPSAWLPQYHSHRHLEVFQGGVWKPCEKVVVRPRRARSLVSVRTAFEGIQVPTM